MCIDSSNTGSFISAGTLFMAIDMKWSSRKRASARVQEPITAETSTVSPSSCKKQNDSDTVNEQTTNFSVDTC